MTLIIIIQEEFCARQIILKSGLKNSKKRYRLIIMELYLLLSTITQTVQHATVTVSANTILISKRYFHAFTTSTRHAISMHYKMMCLVFMTRNLFRNLKTMSVPLTQKGNVTVVSSV